MNVSSITMLPIEQLEPHPNNPRKNLGDLTELIESIRQTGVLQNLTVVPYNDKYRIIIGHRRHQAACKAGLKELPVVIADMSEKEQQQIMLTENLQRSDLTFIEQADGFQLLMDLGSTVEDISKETGFAESTIYHRLNIAKLSKKSIKKAEKEAGGQLRLSDFILLEKVKDIKTRNELLEDWGGSGSFSFRVERAAEEEKEKEHLERLVAEAKKAGMKEREYYYSWNCPDKIKDYKSGDKIKKNLPKTDYYGVRGSNICFYNLKTKEELAKEKQEKQEKKVDKAEEIRKTAIAEIEKQEQVMKDDIFAFVESQIAQAEPEEKDRMLIDLLRIALDPGEFSREEEPSLCDVIIKQLRDETRTERYTTYWDAKPSAYGHSTLSALYDYLEPMGFEWKAAQKKLIKGTHNLQKAIENRHNVSEEDL